MLSMIVYLMNTINSKHKVKERFRTLLEKYPNIDVKAMGFPENWNSEKLWG